MSAGVPPTGLQRRPRAPAPEPVPISHGIPCKCACPTRGDTVASRPLEYLAKFLKEFTTFSEAKVNASIHIASQYNLFFVIFIPIPSPSFPIAQQEKGTLNTLSLRPTAASRQSTLPRNRRIIYHKPRLSHNRFALVYLRKGQITQRASDPIKCGACPDIRRNLYLPDLSAFRVTAER